MKNILIPVMIAAMLATAGCATQSRSTVSDIVVLPLGGEVQVTDGSIVYALPMTVFEFDIIAERTIEVPGPYAAYAGEMLGLDNVTVSETELWSLADMQLSTVEELDPGQFYVIQGTTLMHTNLLAMKESGLVLDINPDVYSHTGYSQLQGGGMWSGLLFPDRGAYEYVSTRTDTAYKVVKADTAFIRVPYLVQKKKGMTVAEEAREAADRLLELREGRHMILTGETNIFPQDGAVSILPFLPGSNGLRQDTIKYGSLLFCRWQEQRLPSSVSLRLTECYPQDRQGENRLTLNCCLPERPGNSTLS